MSAQITKWVFIGGAPRSGTSLLQAIFNQHSECTSPPESHIKETFVYGYTTRVAKIFKERKELVALLEKDRWVPRLGIDAAEVVNELPKEATAVDMFTLYMNKYAARFNKHVLVEGAPLNMWFMKKLHEDFPGCYILHIVRDPRDVILSTRKANYNKNIDFPLERIAVQFMETYMQSVLFADKFYGDHYIKIYYEDLVTKPEETIRMMCSKLGIGFEEAMIEFQKSSGNVAAKEEDWKVNLSKPFMKDNFDKWKQEMTEQEILQTEYICYNFFERERAHYKKSELWNKSALYIQKNLLPIYIKDIKAGVRNLLGKKSQADLDKLPPHERMRVRGMLKVD